jgi:fructokinase
MVLDFIPYRRAELFMNQISSEILTKTKIFHTTCFALSKNPRKNYFNKAQEAYDKGCKLSIDLNYAKALEKEKKHLRSSKPIVSSIHL